MEELRENVAREHSDLREWQEIQRVIQQRESSLGEVRSREGYMRAMAVEEFGVCARLKPTELPIPEVGEGEVRIRIEAAGVNPVDWKIREGYLKEYFPHRFPISLGWDAAGVVDRVGPGCSTFSEGDEVFAYCRLETIHYGSYAEYIVLPEQNVAHKPKNLTFVEAAVVPLAALTAWQALFEHGKLKQGQHVLIHAAAGGVGSYAVQLAKHRGAIVYGTANPENHSFLRALGCDYAIDHRYNDFRHAVRDVIEEGVHLVLDAVGGDVLKQSFDVLRPGMGRIVSLVRSPESEAIQRKHSGECCFMFVEPNQEQLSALASMIENSELKSTLTHVLPLQKAEEALQLSKGGHVRGKIALTVAQA